MHSIGLLLDWMLEQKYVDAAPKRRSYPKYGYDYDKYWGLYGPTYKSPDIWIYGWIDYIQ